MKKKIYDETRGIEKVVVVEMCVCPTCGQRHWKRLKKKQDDKNDNVVKEITEETHT